MSFRFNIDVDIAGVPQYAYRELCEPVESPGFHLCWCDVFADKDGYLITVETDYESGSAMMTLPCAELAHAALGRAIEAARLARKRLEADRRTTLAAEYCEALGV